MTNHLVIGAAAGIVAGIVTGQSERILDRLISRKQKRRERRVREASPHQLAAPVGAEKILGRKPTDGEEQAAQIAFGLLYGVGWGLLYAATRRRFPQVTRAAGLPFALPFFFVCDGLIAPLIGLSPPLRQIPWQPSAKELVNHAVWTATAELLQRGADRARSGVR